MSFRKEKKHSLIGVNYSEYNAEQLQNLSSTVLENGMHGLCFSPYGEGQKPGDLITEAQIRRRLEIIAPYTKWIRSFSCTEGNDMIPKLAKEYGLKTLVLYLLLRLRGFLLFHRVRYRYFKKASV